MRTTKTGTRRTTLAAAAVLAVGAVMLTGCDADTDSNRAQQNTQQVASKDINSRVIHQTYRATDTRQGFYGELTPAPDTHLPRNAEVMVTSTYEAGPDALTPNTPVQIDITDETNERVLSTTKGRTDRTGAVTLTTTFLLPSGVREFHVEGYLPNPLGFTNESVLFFYGNRVR